jgi:hypothetical protein
VPRAQIASVNLVMGITGTVYLLNQGVQYFVPLTVITGKSQPLRKLPLNVNISFSAEYAESRLG